LTRSSGRPVYWLRSSSASTAIAPAANSCSQDRPTPLTLPTVTDTLPGRIEYLNLWPLSQGELRNHRETFIDDLFDGRFPQVAGAPSAAAPSPPCWRPAATPSSRDAPHADEHASSRATSRR
jgi:hypothetical protein